MISRRKFIGVTASLCLAGLLGATGCSQNSSSSSSAANTGSSANASSSSATSTDASASASSSQSAATACVLCFSATNTTWGVAQTIASVTGANLVRLEPEQAYTSDDLNYNDDSTRATVEQNEGTARPAISGGTPDLAAYNTIYLGYPIWWGKAPRIILTFLESANLSNKTIIPFCTSGSSGIEGSLDEIEAAATGATWKNAKRLTSSTTEQDIKSWLGL